MFIPRGVTDTNELPGRRKAYGRDGRSSAKTALDRGG